MAHHPAHPRWHPQQRGQEVPTMKSQCEPPPPRRQEPFSSGFFSPFKTLPWPTFLLVDPTYALVSCLLTSHLYCTPNIISHCSFFPPPPRAPGCCQTLPPARGMLPANRRKCRDCFGCLLFLGLCALPFASLVYTPAQSTPL